MVTALVFIRTDVDAVNNVAETIAAIDGVSEVYSVTGDLDLVALVRVRALVLSLRRAPDASGAVPACRS